jgi:uridine kinase
MQGKTINITYENSTYATVIGNTVRETLEGLSVNLNKTYLENPIVAASVNDEVVPLSYHLVNDAEIKAIPLFSSLGKRTYRHSICFLLCYASQLVFPDRKLLISHSLGDGYFFYYDKTDSVAAEDTERLSQTMQKIADKNLPIDFCRAPYKKAMEYFLHREAMETVQLLKFQNEPVVALYKLEDFMDLGYEPLVDRTGILSLWKLQPYKKCGMLLRYPRSSDFTQLQEFKDNPLLFSVFSEYRKWNNMLDMRSLGKLNNLCIEGKITDYIRLAETLQQKKISQIADKILAREQVKAIFIAGPSSSGKTTFAYKLGIQLRLAGKKPIKITLDDYYRPAAEIPVGSDGKKDFESLEALDVAQFRSDLENLYEGEKVKIPSFDFPTATRMYPNPPVRMDKDTILIIEGIHGLNPALVPPLEKEKIFKIYISALTQLNIDDHNRISTTDNRILRRIVRDYRTRKTSAYKTLTMWDSVQAGENKHIFPYQNQADTMLNSALDYEIGVLRPLAMPLLKTVKPEDSQAYAISRRLIAFLNIVHPIPENLVPADSLIREFIGGSEFNVT